MSDYSPTLSFNLPLSLLPPSLPPSLPPPASCRWDVCEFLRKNYVLQTEQERTFLPSVQEMLTLVYVTYYSLPRSSLCFILPCFHFHPSLFLSRPTFLRSKCRTVASSKLQLVHQAAIISGKVCVSLPLSLCLLTAAFSEISQLSMVKAKIIPLPFIFQLLHMYVQH